jgi:hypothetical protein
VLFIRWIFFCTLFSEPSDIQKWLFGIKIKILFFSFSNLRPKKIAILIYFYSPLLYIIFTVSMVLQNRQNMNKSMYFNLGPFQNKILFQNKFLFLFCPLLKYFSLLILLSEQIDRK